MPLCLEFAQELQDEQGWSTSEAGQVIDDRDAIGRRVHQGCDDALTGVFSTRDYGVGDRAESPWSKFCREDSAAGIQGCAFGVMTLLQHGQGLQGQRLVQALIGRACHDRWPGHVEQVVN